MVAVAAAAALVVGSMVPAGADPSPFTGRWSAIDIDGSNLLLTIGGGPSPVVNLYDDGATVCSENVPPDVAARARGTGTVAGDTLSSTLNVFCLTPSPVGIGPFGYELTLNPDGTLTDGLGVLFTRV